MKKLFLSLAVATLMASCNSSSTTETEVTTSDSTSTVVDTCHVDSTASAKVDSTLTK